MTHEDLDVALNEILCTAMGILVSKKDRMGEDLDKDPSLATITALIDALDIWRENNENRKQEE